MNASGFVDGYKSAATDHGLSRMKITGMKGAPFMEVIFFLLRQRSVVQPAAEGDFFYMSSKPVPV